MFHDNNNNNNKQFLQLQLSQRPLSQQSQQLHPLQQQPRRGSFLYRNENYDALQSLQSQLSCTAPATTTSRNNLSQLPSCQSSLSTSPTSIPEHLYPEDHFVTPFALILHRLQIARNNYVDLNQIHDKRRRRSSSGYIDPINKDVNTTNKDATSSRDATTNTLLSLEISKENEDNVLEILDDMDWCLDQLEAIQTHRSLGDLTSSKFKKILKRELDHLSESGRTGNQISQYISKTFLDKEEEPSKDIELERTSVSQQKRPSRSSITPETPSKSTTPGSQRRVRLLSPAVSPVRTSMSPCASMSIIPLFHEEIMHNKDPTTLENISSSKFERKNDSENKNCKNTETSSENTSKNFKNNVVNNNNNDKNNNNKNTSSTNSFLDESLAFGVEGLDESAVQKHLGKLDDWDLDVFQLDGLSCGHPLIVVGYSIFKQRGMMERFQIEDRTLLNYLASIEKHYHLSPLYHNRIHAADVTNSVHVLLNKTPLLKVFSDVEILSTIFASIIHDVDHPGLTNQHLINTNSDLALMYNDESILENHHLAVAFKLLQYPGCDIFQNFTENSRKRIRKNVISMVLSTDMSKHMSLLAGLKTMVEARKVSGTGVLVFDEANDRLQVLKCLLHCADLANPTKQLNIYQGWIERVMNEFHKQGDIERELGMEISPMCDRNNASVEKSQVGFIDFVVQPLWETWAELVEPYCNDILHTIDSNKQYYQLLNSTSPEANIEKDDGDLHKDDNEKSESDKNKFQFEFPRKETNVPSETDEESKDNKKGIMKKPYPVRITIEKSNSIMQEENYAPH